jgi:hypothetical protein
MRGERFAGAARHREPPGSVAEDAQLSSGNTAGVVRLTTSGCTFEPIRMGYTSGSEGSAADVRTRPLYRTIQPM